MAVFGHQRFNKFNGLSPAMKRSSWSFGMNTLTIEVAQAKAQSVSVTDSELIVQLTDGRTVSVPLAWYPRLLHATPEERRRWELLGQGEGIHWPDLDEDIAVTHLLAGVPSGESQYSLKKWLDTRKGQAL